MQTAAQPAPISRGLIWFSYVLSAIPVLLMLFSGTAMIIKPAGIVQSFAHFGYAESVIVWLGIVEISCAVLYLIPRTSVLGAILVTGYLGGATATHVRIGEPAFILAVFFGIMVWGGLFLRESRLRELLPFRR